MKRFFLFLAALCCGAGAADACTNFIVTRGASSDGSVMVTYAADSHQLYGALYKYDAPRRAYRPGAVVPVYEWDTGRFLGDIMQVPETYSTVGNMNEKQLIIAESTFGGLPQLEDSTGGIDYGSLIYIALQRASTARQAIDVIVELATRYGYCSSGESFSIADKNEAWIMELIGKGCRMVDGRNADRGIVWVARRIPDGYVCGHANQSRIAQFPLDDPQNCLYAPDVISFARGKGLYDGRDEDFSFCDTYCPLDFGALRGCEARVWSFFNRVADGMDAYTDYAMGYNPANRMPLWVKPDRKITPKMLFDCMRDHYEGTPLDMRSDIGAGGHALPYRWRPMDFEVDGVKYLNERATATQQTGFWFTAQARGWLDDHIGGLLWFGVDDAATSALTPIYCSTREVPWCLSEENGHMTQYSSTSMFWLMNRVAQFAYLRYDAIGGEVRRTADTWETECLDEVARTDAAASGMKKRAAEKFLTQYSLRKAQELFNLWSCLDRYLLVKYMDGNIKRQGSAGEFEDNGYGRNIPASPLFPGYGERWKRAVADGDDGTLKSR